MPTHRISVHCSKEDAINRNSFTYLYLTGYNRFDILFFRRSWSYETCLWRKEKIQRILNKKKPVKVTGIEGDFLGRLPKFEPDDEGYSPQLPPSIRVYSWTFDRIENDENCEGYFEQSCQGRPLEWLGDQWVIKKSL